MSTWNTYDTPMGPFTAVVDDDGAVLASGWTAELDELVPLIHPTLRPVDLRQGELGAVGDAIVAYHGGDLSPSTTCRCASAPGRSSSTRGTSCARCPRARPVTYTEYAAKSGRPAAVRAAAAACARNAAALFVPCHRVVRTDGTLGGFRWGLDVKRALLAHERG